MAKLAVSISLFSQINLFKLSGRPFSWGSCSRKMGGFLFNWLIYFNYNYMAQLVFSFDILDDSGKSITQDLDLSFGNAVSTPVTLNKNVDEAASVMNFMFCYFLKLLAAEPDIKDLFPAYDGLTQEELTQKIDHKDHLPDFEFSLGRVRYVYPDNNIQVLGKSYM